MCCDHAVVRNWIAHVYGSYQIWMVGCIDIDYAVTVTVWRKSCGILNALSHAEIE